MANDNNVSNNQNNTTQSREDIIRLLGITDIPVRIPIEFIFVYNKLLLVMIELGESMLLDCNALCNKQNMPIVECYHMFKAALAAKQLAATLTTEDDETQRNYYEKLASTLLNYVKTQLNCITENYSDDLSFTLPIGSNGLVNLFITQNDINTEVIVNTSDINEININQIASDTLSIIQGSVVTEDSENTYGLTTEELAAKTYWHVIEGHEFVPGSSSVYINGVRYYLDDDDYEEWVVTDGDTQKAIGIKLLSGSFDIGDNADEIYVEAKLITNSNSN